jgi:hypothetical protein
MAVELLLKVVQERLVLGVLKELYFMIEVEIRKNHFLSILNRHELQWGAKLMLEELKLLVRFAVKFELKVKIRFIDLESTFKTFEVFKFLESLILEEILFILEGL